MEADEQLVKALLQFRNCGEQLPHHWSTISNEAAFGTDYFTRTAVAKSNIFVNAPVETKYFYQDLDASGARLNGARRYKVTFARAQTPPVHGFWSLTLYNEHHFFSPNAISCPACARMCPKSMGLCRPRSMRPQSDTTRWPVPQMNPLGN